MEYSTSGLRVLIVEDNLGDYLLIEDYLKEGFENVLIKRAATFAEAKIACESPETIDIIILDLTLPDLSGKELISAITEITGDLPLIVLTGFGNINFGFKTISSGVSDYLLKNDLSSSQLQKSIVYSIERYRINSQLKASEAKYKTLFRASPMPKWIYDIQTLKFVDVNDAALSHYGYSREEFMSMTIRDIKPHGERGTMKEAVAENNNSDKIIAEYRHQKKNGDIIDVEVQSSSIDLNGLKARVVLVTDITQRLASENALYASEQRYKTLVQESGDLISIISEDGEIQYSSPNHRPILGWDDDNLKGHNIVEFVHPDDTHKVREFYKSLVVRKRTYSNPYRVKNSKGKWTWIESIGTNAINDKEVKGLLLNSRDVTLRIKNERQLKEVNDRFAAIAKATSDAIYDYDYLTGEIFLAGSSYQALLGYEFKDNTTDNAFFVSALHPDERDEVMKTLENAKNSKKKHFEMEYRFLRHDGSYAYILDRFDIIREDGKAIKKVGAMQDISVRKFNETVLEFEKDIYELNANPKIDFSTVIKKLIANIELLIPDALCTIVVMDDDEVKYIVGNAIDPNYLRDIESFKIGPATGSCGTALYTGKKVIVSDISTDPLWTPYAEIAKKYDLQACWSIPVKKSSGKIVASFATYYKTRKTPLASEINLAERAASLVGVLFENRYAFDETERAKERYDIVAKATSDTIWDWNILEDKFEWNKGINGVFGYKRNEVGSTSRWWFDRIHPEDSIKMSVKLYSFLEQKTEKWQDEYRFACADGTYKYVYDRAFLVKDVNGKAIRMIGAMQDVTRAKQEEQRLKLLETVITQMKDSVIITEAEKSGSTIPKIVFVNPAFTAMTGFKSSEVIGKPPTVFLDRKTVRQNMNKLIQALKTKQEFKFETLNIRKNGEPYWVNFSMLPITNNEGDHSHWISIQRDITEEKRQEKEKEQLIRELTQNNKDLKQFSYITSHNLRAPLSNLTGLLNLIEDMPIENQELKEILNGFHKSTHLLNETINDLVRVVIIKDNPSIDKEEVLIKDVFENVFNQLSFMIGMYKPIIKLELERVSILNINKAYLESILLNLLTNAIKYRSQDRKLKIFVSSKIVGDSILLVFRDNGIGIDLDRNKDKIFGLYQRFHNYPDSKGLGLYLVKSQVESMGGSISVESSVDKGTTFIITFKKQTT